MILVTGGTGLVGSHLLFDLSGSGENIRAIYRSKKSLEAVKKVFSYYTPQEEALSRFNSIEWIEADITNVPALKKAFLDVDRVYHCAALISFDDAKDTALRKTNIEGTANVVNFCIKEKVQKLCFVSSVATLDQKPGEKVITEESHWNKELDHNMYAITKYGAEMEVWRASQEGIPVVIVNPGVIIGPGFWDSGSGLIFKRLANGLKYYFTKTTGFVGVDDVVKACVKLMASPIKNEQFIVVSENISFKHLFELVAKSLQKPAPSKKLKPWMIYIFWIYQEIASFFFGKEKQVTGKSASSLFETTIYSGEKLSRELNFTYTPMKEVIEKTGEFFKKDITDPKNLDS
ncbi:NAD-dependent epimerase/dehydratase family protein [Salinimicrobium soli]|uniref:NAD-dependent epimerase/dehydratase family protein n=1 Tax=Salinimicrobium soli TaxID=1254399 RepID=UPI003AAB8B0A